jgi:hypothetical protein
MTDLVACVGTGKGTWTGVFRLAAMPEFESAFLIVNEWTKNTLKMDNPKIKLIMVSDTQPTMPMRDSIIAQLKGQVRGFEVAVNMDSGTGKEHTAMITALMRLGLAFRFVVFENEKMEEVSYDLQMPTEEKEFY